MSKIRIYTILLLSILFYFSLGSKLKEAKYMNNIDYLFCGYNIFYGNPFPVSGNVDPGFKENIFQVEYTNQMSGDRRFYLPLGSSLRQIPGCDLSLTNSEITGENSYRNSLKIETTVEGSVKGIEFSASNEFKNVSEETKKNKITYINSSADCKIYLASINQFGPPKFHSNFISGLRYLSGKSFENEKESYYEFIKSFGTHYVSEVRMGARFGARTKLTANNLSKFRSNSFKIKRSLGIENLAKFSFGLENTNEHTSKLDSLFEETKIYSIGSPIPKDLKAETWVAETAKDPMPIKYTLIPINEVLLNKRLKHNLNDEDYKGLDFTEISSNLKIALDNYCTDYLLKNGEVKSCDKLNPDLEINSIITDDFEPNTTIFYVKNYETGTCISTTQNNSPIVNRPCEKLNEQKFYFDWGHNPHGYGIISDRTRGYDIALDNLHAESDENTPIYDRVNANHRNQAWEIKINEDRTITIISVSSGKCIQPKDGNKNTYTLLVINLCNGSDVQKWILERA